MNKIITIFLILLFTVNEFSFITLYLPLKNLASMVQKARLEDCYNSDEFALIVVKESEMYNQSSSVKFLEKSELSYNGDLYDIVETVVKDSDVYIYCIKDDTENLLDKSFSLRYDNHQNKKFSFNFFNLTNAKKLIAFVFTNDIYYGITLVEKISIDNYNIFLKPFIDKYSPPPKIS